MKSDPILGIEAPAVVITDRCREIYLAACGAGVSDLPPAAAILECVRYVAYECPECQGETH